MSFVFTACEKEEPEVSTGLSYSLNGSATVLKTDSALASVNDNIIVAYQSGNENIFLYVTSLNVGTYAFSRSTETDYIRRKANPKAYNGFFYGLGPDYDVWFQGTAGTITITSDVNNKISGTFDITAGYGEGETPVTTVKGSFNNIEKTERHLIEY